MVKIFTRCKGIHIAALRQQLSTQYRLHIPFTSVAILHGDGLEVNPLLAAIVAVTGIRDDKLAVHETRVDSLLRLPLLS